MSAQRKLYQIAFDIRNEWKNVYFGAEPYLTAMSSMNFIEDKYGLDDGREIVLRFLSNAGSFRGELACNEMK